MGTLHTCHPRVGDFVPTQPRALAIVATVRDPETRSLWLTLETGVDVEVFGRVTVYRARALAPHVAAASEAYRHARDAWESDCERVALGYATERREYAHTRPAPRYADFLKQSCANI